VPAYTPTDRGVAARRDQRLEYYNVFLEGFNACFLLDKTPMLQCSNIETASQAGLPQGLRNWNWHNYDPRVRVAYRPFNDSKTVIGAGYGIYTMTTLGPMSFNSGIIALSDLLTFNNSVTNDAATFQLPQTSPPGAPAIFRRRRFRGGKHPNWKDPSSAQWNLTVERQVTAQLHRRGQLRLAAKKAAGNSGVTSDHLKRAKPIDGS
jgi:hypothetical protein